MHYRSVADLNRAVIAWADVLPRDVSLVVGIPRSGLLSATLLALHLNVALADLDGWLEGRHLGVGHRGVRTSPSSGSVLVVDDSVDSGAATAEARRKVAERRPPGRVLFGAVYGSKHGARHVDLCHEIVPMPRVFEWNVLHHPVLQQACMDIDGVLCRDPRPEENDDGDAYGRFLSDVPARLVPNVKVGRLVTARLERYRPSTEAWLDRAGIRYGDLVMYQGTAEERRSRGDHGSFKAQVYADSRALLFIESSLDQAVTIAAAAGKPVFCTDASRMVYPGDAPGITALQDLRWSMAYRSERAARRAVQRVPGLHGFLKSTFKRP